MRAALPLARRPPRECCGDGLLAQGLAGADERLDVDAVVNGLLGVGGGRGHVGAPGVGLVGMGWTRWGLWSAPRMTGNVDRPRSTSPSPCDQASSSRLTA